ncbi:hypothetical protein OG943_11320 [Amycolatopsis sp. NBC_00345]|uniref:hypothetical protein n=1 Tax=Amycolatopsis sp. NBC_00345 TaxID=2975955 RepID=UPI002E26095D
MPAGTRNPVRLCQCVCAVLGHHHEVCDEIVAPGAFVAMPAPSGVRPVPACLGCHAAARVPARAGSSGAHR